MKPTPHHYLALIIAIGVFALSIFGYVFMYDNIGSQIVQTTKAETAVQDEERIAAQQHDISASLAATAADRAAVGSFILSGDATLPFINTIEGLTKVSGAEVSLVSISSDAANLHAHIDIQGSWSNTLRAMHLIENLPYSLSMANVRISLQGTSLWNEEFDITIPTSTTDI